MTETMRIYNALATSGVTKPVTGWSEFVSSFNNGDVAVLFLGFGKLQLLWMELIKAEMGCGSNATLNISNGVNASNEGGLVGLY